MKKCLILIILFPLTLIGQLDLDTRYFTITQQSLPEVEALSTFTFEKTPFVKRSLNEFEMNAVNYRKAVDMASVVNEDANYEQKYVNVKAIQSEFYGFGAPNTYQSDGTTRTKNIVYKEMRGLEFVGTCPPFGVCARCAPYRIGRGF